MGSEIGEIGDKLLGKEFETKKCGKCFIIDYKNYNNVLVLFYEPFCIVKCSLGSLQKGHVSNPMFPTFLGKGYIGVGKYTSKNCGRIYKLWTGVLRRCLGTSYLHYKDVEVCKEWLNFQNFAKWCETQEFFNAKDEMGRSYQLDKDILVKGNKIYSPETCRFVPQVVNTLLITNKTRRGVYPIGVSYAKKLSKFVAECRYSGGSKFLGNFNTVEEAFKAYKMTKEAYVKEVAERWKDNIDSEIYESLLEWSVNKTD